MLYESIIRRIPIEKGWSGDKKYRIECADGNVYLLRVSPPEKAQRRKAEFERTCRVAELGTAMNLPLEFGIHKEGVCTILSWVDGFDAEEHIPTLSREEQYRLGLDAGIILKKMHHLPAPDDAEDWEIRFNKKIDRKIAMYDACPLKYEGGEAFLKHIAENRHLLAGRPQSYQHGDYHIGNMMVTKDSVLTVIDFEKDDWGDPWEEFNRIVWSAQAAPRFSAGMADGYFGGEVPMDFWKLLALYICSNTLSSLPWAVPFGKEQDPCDVQSGRTGPPVVRQHGKSGSGLVSGMSFPGCRLHPGFFRSHGVFSALPHSPPPDACAADTRTRGSPPELRIPPPEPVLQCHTAR